MARPKSTVPWLARRGSADNGVFYAFWYDPATRRVGRLSLATTDPAEAEIRFADFLLNSREIRKPRVGALTVAQALDDYYDEHVAKNVVAARRQMDAIRNLKAFYKNKALDDVDVPSSRQYAEARTTGLIGGGARRKIKAVTPSTVRRELNVLVAAANHAVWMKRWKGVVMVDLPPEKRLGQDDEAPYFSREEIAQLLETPGELGRFIHLAYFTGARKKSIEDLGRSQVKWRERRILLQRPGKVSTKKRQPIVPILKAMEPALKALCEDGGAERLFECADFYRPFKARCAEIGVADERAHPHTLRHSRATHLLQDGKSIYDVARLLGDTPATIERVYGHHSPDHLAASLED